MGGHISYTSRVNSHFCVEIRKFSLPWQRNMRRSALVLCDTHDTTILIVDTSCRYRRYLRGDTTAVYRSSKNIVRRCKYWKYRDTVQLVPLGNECTQQACDAKTKLIKSQ